MEKKLRELKDQGVLNDAAYFSVQGLVLDLKADILQMISDWEGGIDPADKTLYSLALRRAMDLVIGESSMDNKEEEENE